LNITLVTKVKLDGHPCRKSAKVLNHLKKLDLLSKIDTIIAADERKPSSEGFHLALKHQIDTAPFFIIQKNDATDIYTSYGVFLRNVFKQQISEQEEIFEIMAQTPFLEFI
jgi:predicted GTPase